MNREVILALYRKMAEIRSFELEARELFRSGQMPGFIHLYVGEEAVAAGVIANLTSEDYVASTHRGHGHALAKGISPRQAMAELMGKSGGCCGGRGGSMHLYDPNCGFLGTNGVVPPGIPIGAGAALSAKLRKSSQVAVSFFGDGAVNSGSFHEALNIAARWDLPVVFVCENNLYATETPFFATTKNTSVASRGKAYGMPSQEVDGTDVLVVYEQAEKAIDRARLGGGPTLLECLTYRWYGHHEGDPGTGYREKAEVESWKERDPIERIRRKVAADYGIAAIELAAIDQETKELIADAVKFSLASPRPEPSTALDNVYCK